MECLESEGNSTILDLVNHFSKACLIPFPGLPWMRSSAFIWFSLLEFIGFHCRLTYIHIVSLDSPPPTDGKVRCHQQPHLGTTNIVLICLFKDVLWHEFENNNILLVLSTWVRGPYTKVPGWSPLQEGSRKQNKRVSVVHKRPAPETPVHVVSDF